MTASKTHFTASEKQKFLKKFHAPSFAESCMDIIFTEEEISFVLQIAAEPFSHEDVCQILEERADAFIKSAYHRGVLSYTDETKEKMKFAGFYERMDVMSVSEQALYRTIPEADRKKICDWLFEQYYLDLDPNPAVRPTDDEVLPLEQVLAFIDSKKDLPVYLNYCDCKSLNGECGKPTDTCITYKTKVNSYFDRGLSRPIDAEKAKEIVIAADKAGLMHTVNATGICNCCNDCCYLSRSRTKRGSGAFWPKADYRVVQTSEKCISCGKCIKRCWMGVFSKEEGIVTADTSKCIGCGICATECPKDALTMVKR